MNEMLKFLVDKPEFVLCVNLLKYQVGLSDEEVAAFVANATAHVLDEFIAFVAEKAAEDHAMAKDRRN